MSPGLLRVILGELGFNEQAQENTANAKINKVFYFCPRSVVSFAKIH